MSGYDHLIDLAIDFVYKIFGAGSKKYPQIVQEEVK